MVPKVILFRTEHSRRTLVPKVDFISAPGRSPPNVYRPGGPIALVTNRCALRVRPRARRLPARQRASRTHGRRGDRATGFAFERPEHVPETPRRRQKRSRSCAVASRSSSPRSIRNSPSACSASAWRAPHAARAFSSEVDTGSREENASKQKAGAPALIPSKPERL